MLWSFSHFLRLLGGLFLAASVLGFFAIPLVAYEAHHTGLDESYALVSFAIVAALLGTIFPLVAHFSVAANRDSGIQFSQLYAANIVGSAADSLLTGLVLLDWLSLREVSLFITFYEYCQRHF